MSNQNMNWNQFLTEYMLRAMTNYQIFEEYKAQQMVEFARRAWDAMQAAPLPDSEKAKLADANNLQTMPTTKEQLKRIAEEAAAHGFKWIAQDKFNGMWYGYTVKPQFVYDSQEWRTEPNSDYHLIEVPNDTDYSKQLFNVNELLNNEQ